MYYILCCKPALEKLDHTSDAIGFLMVSGILFGETHYFKIQLLYPCSQVVIFPIPLFDPTRISIQKAFQLYDG